MTKFLINLICVIGWAIVLALYCVWQIVAWVLPFAILIGIFWLAVISPVKYVLISFGVFIFLLFVIIAAAITWDR